MKTLIILFFVLALGVALHAEPGLSEDDLFSSGDDNLVNSAEKPGSENDGSTSALIGDSQSLLQSDTVKVGGNLDFGAGASIDPAYLNSALVWPDRGTTTLDLSSTLYVDARPSKDLRVFVKGQVAYPFDKLNNYLLREMFADLTIGETVFARLGKQTINWGLGRFYSPANIINLENRNPEKPDDELLGPVAIKLHMPVNSDNYYLYSILQDFDTRKTVGVGVKAEWLLGESEIGLGAVWRPEQPWAVTAGISTRLWQFDVYAEAVLKGMDDRNFVVEDKTSPIGLRTESHADRLNWSATGGISWSINDEQEYLNLDVAVQYYYNGAGYADQQILINNRVGIGALVAGGKLSTRDLYQSGQHYGAASVSLSDLFKSQIGVSVLWLGNLQDGSGKVIPSISYSGIDKLKFSLSYTVGYGVSASEYSPNGYSQALGLSVDLVNCNF